MERDSKGRGRFFIRTFGCQMNERDSERMAGFLLEAGLERADREEEADLIVINTCSVRKKPEQKIYSLLGRMKKLKTNNPGLIIAVAGCVAQQVGDEFLARVPHLDLVIGTNSFHRIAGLFGEAEKGKRAAAAGWLAEDDPMLFCNPSTRPAGGPTAFVTIMQGCDNFCSFCIVPYVRGRERSRSAEDIISEARSLAASGVREVTLLGQNVNSYGKKGGPGFPGLLRMVAAVDGIERVRFTTSHPKDLSAELIEVMAEEAKVMEHIHLPVQAGSTRVLAAMNRGYTREDYLDLVSRLRKAVPGIGITTDLMVGFPGETEADFGETLSLLEEVLYDEAFSFAYSHRPFTRASRLAGEVPEEDKKERLYRLQALQDRITLERNRAEVGRVHEVLVEGASKTDSKKLTGRARTNRLVHFVPEDGADLCGSRVRVRVTRALKHSLAGELISR